MELIATTIIEGPEAKGEAFLYRNNDGSYMVRIPKIWIAPGAPDVYFSISYEETGHINDSLTDIARVDYSIDSFDFAVPADYPIDKFVTVIVYCRVYQAHFGHGVWEYQ